MQGGYSGVYCAGKRESILPVLLISSYMILKTANKWRHAGDVHVYHGFQDSMYEAMV